MHRRQDKMPDACFVAQKCMTSQKAEIVMAILSVFLQQLQKTSYFEVLALAKREVQRMKNVDKELN